MRSRNWTLAPTLIALVLAIATIPAAFAQCGFPTKLAKPSAWETQSDRAHLLRTEESSNPSVVGMWHVIFTAETADPATAPPGAVIDDALVVWHSDGTEIMNSRRPPQDGNFCLGVWQRVGRNKYKLNHFAWYAKQFPTGPGDQGTDIGPSVGPTHITETITLSADGQSFTGKFRLDAYDTNNAIVQSFTGTVTGTRITISTKESDLVTMM